MEVFRISKKNFANLEGVGGLFFSGRWHEKGNRVIYTSEHRSLAALEFLVHLSSVNLIDNDFVIASIHIPDNIPVLELPKNILATGWNGPNYLPVTQNYGTNFLKDNKYMVLKVPSAIIDNEYNFIINPLSVDFYLCKIIDIKAFSFDKRFRGTTS
jgi:RES domain-containing protein